MQAISDFATEPRQYSVGGRNSWRWLGEVIGVAAVVYLGVRLGRTVAPPPGFTTVFWPPSEIAVAALLILGKRVWPGVLLGAMLSTNWSGTDLSNLSTVFRVLAMGGASTPVRSWKR